MEIVPRASTREAGSLAVASWDNTSAGKQQEERGTGQRVRGMVQRGGEEESGQPGEQAIRGEGGQGPGCCLDRKPHLGSRTGRLIPRCRSRRRAARLGRGPQAGQSEHPKRDEHEVGHGQRLPHPLRQAAGDQRADAKCADRY
jgi:hypothetical protein